MRRQDVRVGCDYALQGDGAFSSAVPLDLERVRLLEVFPEETSMTVTRIAKRVRKAAVQVSADKLAAACTRVEHHVGRLLVQHVGDDGELAYEPAQRVVGIAPIAGIVALERNADNDRFVQVVTEEDLDAPPTPCTRLLRTAGELYMPWDAYVAKRDEAAAKLAASTEAAQKIVDDFRESVQRAAEQLRALGLTEFEPPRDAYVRRMGNTAWAVTPSPPGFVITIDAILKTRQAT